ncbi:MAG TPA: FtsX-like permease family protein, partial [Candidatus Saccharimonadales bacterium]|nr:FtsX-like permease family protein [Candidatus Saccharimonadales bacterium]
STKYLDQGKEDLLNIGKTTPANSDLSLYGYSTHAVRNSSYAFVDQHLLEKFMLPDVAYDSTAIPVVISTEEAVDLFGTKLAIHEEPSTPHARVAWLKDLKTKTAGQTYLACYRNQADIDLINTARNQSAEILENKDTKDYQPPKLLYEMPRDTCGPVTIKSDTRSASEKAAEEKANSLVESPRRKLLKFQVVGLIRVQPQSGQNNLTGLFTQLLSVDYDNGAMIPKQMYEQRLKDLSIEDILKDQSQTEQGTALTDAGIHETIVSFKSLAQAKAFLAKGCSEFTNSCDKPFMLSPYGTNYLLLEDIGRTIKTVTVYALFAICCIAGVIMFFTIIRIIADSRHETAIFRAVGAKKGDIVSIYILYSLGVAARVAVAACAIGVLLTTLVWFFFKAAFEDYVQAAFGVIQEGASLSLIQLNPMLSLLIILIIFIVVLLAAIVPILLNAKRNPAYDLKEG